MRLFRIGWVAALVLVAAGAAAPGTLDPASIQEHTLPNGLQVVIKESHAADLVAVQYWVRAGSYLETAQTAGTAHFIEHMWFKGTDRRPAGDIDEEIEDLGGILEADTDKDWSVVRTTVASRFAGKALDVIADVVQHPRFQPTAIESERSIIVDEISSAHSDPIRFLIGRLYAAAFPSHPYRFEVTGTQENVLAFKQPQLKEYFRKKYALSNAILVIDGDVQPEEMLRQVKALFPTPGPPAKRPALPPADSGPGSPAPPLVRGAGGAAAMKRQVLDTQFRAGYYGISYPAPGMEAPQDIYAADVLVTLMEQSPWGRLPAALRDVAVTVRANYQTLRQPGLFSVTVQTSPDKLDRVEQAVQAEIEKLRAAPPTPAELEGSKRILTGMYAVENETFAGQARTLGYYAAIDRWQFASTYLDNIRKVTAQQVQQAAIRYLTADRAVTVLLRPGHATRGAPERSNP
jgi:zinc protease